MSVYLDTSAAAKLLMDEAESDALAAFLDEIGDEQDVVSSALLETELRRLAVRLGLDQSAVTDLLARVDLVDPPRSLFHEAGLLPGPYLRSLDAIHLATALRVDADTLVAYDARFLDAARSLGLGAHSPA
ncbi:MAG: type II toxin-antitoxin system VapC family toxin [Nocardioidaceae bacterium]